MDRHLETGTNWGCSTIVLAQALKDSGYEGIVHTIEIDLDTYERTKLNIRAAQASTVMYIRPWATPKRCSPTLWNSSSKFDSLFSTGRI